MRNCSGEGRPSKIILNNQLYARCPMATYLENPDARYYVNLYFDCRKLNTLPAEGGPLAQTAFVMELFDYLDGIVAETQERNNNAARAEAAKPVKSTKSGR